MLLAILYCLPTTCSSNQLLSVRARLCFINLSPSTPQYITLATEVFTLLNAEIIAPGCERLGQVTLQLHDAHVALLAALAKDLDRETARTDTGEHRRRRSMSPSSPLAAEVFTQGPAPYRSITRNFMGGDL